jgi:hypothetical protein
MHTDIQQLVNELINVLHSLEQHVAPADSTGKRLLHQAHQMLFDLTTAAAKEMTPNR